jgi:integrase
MFTLQKQDEFVKSQFVKSHSIHSRHYYEAGLRRFKTFLDAKEIKEVNNKNVYNVINQFVLWNDERGLKGATIIGYVQCVKKFLLYSDVKIEEMRFKAKVSIPRAMKIEDEPLTMEKIRMLLTVGRPNKSARALILVLLSSGMRLAEALNLKAEDIDFSSRPVRVRIKASYSKTKRERDVFISDEAAEAVKLLLAGVSADRLVFHSKAGNVWQREKIAMMTFKRIRERAGLNDKFNDYKNTFHKIHFHLFRKFFLTKGADTIGEHAAHALCGHSYFLDTYYKKTLEERKEDYLKLMPKLTVFGNQTVDTQEIELVARRGTLALLGFAEQEIDSLGDLSQYSLQDLKRISDEKRYKDLGLNGKSTQKIIPWGDVRQAITEGWELVSKLEDTKEAIVRLPK